LSWLQSEEKAVDILNFYRDYGRSVMWNKFRNLQTIMAVQSYLNAKGIITIQTYMDYELLDNTWSPDSPDYVIELQKCVSPTLSLFNNQLNFLDWARENNFEITDPGWHPIGESHNVAAQLWEERYREKLN
jgi:hypothetical protein